jgi:membrane-bound lytic murein transglycosylase B
MNHSCIATARSHIAAACLAGALLGLFSTTSFARSTCRTEGSFSTWKKKFRREVVAAGIKPGTIRRTYDTVSFQPGIIKRDRRQSFFSLTFA